MAGSSRIIRLFVSSTFSDLKLERDALQRTVFPRLRALCAGHGARFQAVDLRWGVYEEAGLDQQTMDICLGELRRCQAVSPRANFMVLLGDRYGWRPLPARIAATEYETLRAHAAPAEVIQLDGWYRLDQNAAPPDYCLQPRTGATIAYDAWSAVEAELRGILTQALERAPRGAVADPSLYYASATEQEIIAGALDMPDADAAHIHCFFRSISGLSADASAAAYLDLDASGRPDADARAALARLKARLRQRLPFGAIHEYEAQWTGSGVTTDHLAHLCDDVYEALARLIAEALDAEERLQGIEREAAEHARFGQERGRHFQGRANIVRAISDYLTGTDPHPLIIYGLSGTGKSALMAHLAALAPRLAPQAVVIARYIGATATSANPRALLSGLCQQIASSYGQRAGELPGDLEGLAQRFAKLLALATTERPLIILLDALDQLTDGAAPSDAAASRMRLAWLPTDLPPHVRLTLSTAGDTPPDALLARMPAQAMLRLDPLSREEGDAVLSAWLADAQRTLQAAQRHEVLARFAEQGLPLYLRFAFEEARRWKSYTPPAETTLRSGVAGIIGQLFERLSAPANHGPMLVARSLGYLGAARNGLSDDETLDVLSHDAEMLADFRARSPNSPRTDRLPIVVWSRLYFDLEPYLTERASDGVSLLAFYHRQLADAVAATYLAGADGVTRHRALAAYFARAEDGADRLAMAAPGETASVGGVAHLRRLAELPYQQTLGELWADLFATLSDFRFLEEKATRLAVTEPAEGAALGVERTYGGVYLLQEDYALALRRMPAR